MIMGMFLGVTLTSVIGLLLESGVEYYIQVAEILKIISFLFLPQVSLGLLLVKFAEKAVKNYNMITFQQEMQSSCAFSYNPCCNSCKYSITNPSVIFFYSLLTKSHFLCSFNYFFYQNLE